MSQRLHILFLPSWYPSARSPLNGIFNRELASLLSKENRITLLSLQFETGIQAMETRMENRFGFEERIVAMPVPAFGWWKPVRFFVTFFKAYRELAKSNGKPDLSHVLVAWKMGLPALLLRWRYRIPYVVTEHFTGYLKADGSLTGMAKWMSRFLLKRAAANTAVSDGLKLAMEDMGVSGVITIFNCIDPVFLEAEIRTPSPDAPLSIFHASNFALRQKQTDRIIHTFARFRQSHPEAKLTLVVPEEAWKQFVNSNSDLDVSGIRQVAPGLDRNEYAALLSSHHATISFSRFETFGLTVAESLCLGVPVIYTRCGGPEYYVEEDMGIEADPNSDDSLLRAMSDIAVFNGNRMEIAAKARQKFAASKVLSDWAALYRKAVNS